MKIDEPKLIPIWDVSRYYPFVISKTYTFNTVPTDFLSFRRALYEHRVKMLKKEKRPKTIQKLKKRTKQYQDDFPWELL